MRSKPREPYNISEPEYNYRPGFWAKLCGMQCPDCKSLQPPSLLCRTNPHRGWNKYDFLQCDGCDALLFLTGSGRNRRFFLVIIPTILAVSIAMSFLFLALNWEVASGPNKGEPTLGAGLLMIVTLFFTIVALSGRLEKISVAVPERQDVK